MDLRLFEVQHDDEFRELFQVFRAGFTDPGTKLWPIFTGDYRPNASEREAALEEATQRFISWHRSDPTSHWLKVVDARTGKIVGGGRWGLFDTGNPYDEHESMEASWWPEGQPREIASICLNQFLATSAKHMNKPHAFLNILFTHPEYRRKGVGSLVMRWGIEHADKLALECFVEATKEGKPCYERFGFKVIDENNLRVEKGNPNEEWKDLEPQLLPFTWWSMRRDVKA